MPIYLDANSPSARTIDVAVASYGYIVSHLRYENIVDGKYEQNIDRTVTLTNLATRRVQIDIEYLDMGGWVNDACDDKLVITTTPRLPDICSPVPSQFIANLSSNQISFQFFTNPFTEGNGFWLKYSSKYITSISIANVKVQI